MAGTVQYAPEDKVGVHGHKVGVHGHMMASMTEEQLLHEVEGFEKQILRDKVSTLHPRNYARLYMYWCALFILPLSLCVQL